MNLLAKTKLFRTISILTEEEFRKLGEFIKSPYFNKSKKIYKLYTFIKSRQFEPAKTTLEDVSRLLYDDGQHRGNRIRLVLSDFIKLIERFAVCETYKTEDIQNDLRTIRFYRLKGERKSAKDLLQQSMKELMMDLSKDEPFYHTLTNLQIEEYLITSGERLSSSFAEDISEGIVKSSNMYFVVISLKSYIHIVKNNPEMGLTGLLKIPFAKDVLKYVSINIEKIKSEEKLIYVFYLILMQNLEPEKEVFFYEMKRYVFANSASLDPRYTMSFCLHLHTYCTRRLNKGISKFRREAFEIDKMLERNDNLFSRGSIRQVDHVHFVNICYTAIGVGELDWAENFINKHKEDIALVFRENTYNLILAELRFEKGRFDESLEALGKIKLTENLFYLYVQILRMKIFYELNHVDPLFSIIDSINHYIQRNKHIPPTHVLLYKKLLAIALKLARKKFVNKKTNLNTVIKSMKSDVTIPHGDWLMKKAIELEQ